MDLVTWCFWYITLDIHPRLPPCSTACSRHHLNDGFRHCFARREIPFCAPSINGTMAWHRPSALGQPALHCCFTFACPLTLLSLTSSHHPVQCWYGSHTRFGIPLLFTTRPSAFGLPALHCCFAFSHLLSLPPLAFPIHLYNAGV